MAAPPRSLERVALLLLTAADAAANRLYGWRANPLHQSGSIVIALLLVLIVTGLWLILFYRVGAPYASVAAIAADPWVGHWVRGVHRYASDAAVAFTVVHMVRMFAQGCSWGPRALAWTSGVLALALLLLTGLTREPLAHIAIPLGIGLVLWVHLSRVARPAILPPRRLLWALVGVLVVVTRHGEATRARQSRPV